MGHIGATTSPVPMSGEDWFESATRGSRVPPPWRRKLPAVGCGLVVVEPQVS